MTTLNKTIRSWQNAALEQNATCKNMFFALILYKYFHYNNKNKSLYMEPYTKNLGFRCSVPVFNEIP